MRIILSRSQLRQIAFNTFEVRASDIEILLSDPVPEKVTVLNPATHGERVFESPVPTQKGYEYCSREGTLLELVAA